MQGILTMDTNLTHRTTVVDFTADHPAESEHYHA